MLNRLIYNDRPASRALALMLLAVLLGLAFAPFLFPGVKPLGVAAKVLVFIVLVASFDLLLGYTGIVSFAHTMFFGIGAYGVAIAGEASLVISVEDIRGKYRTTETWRLLSSLVVRGLVDRKVTSHRGKVTEWYIAVRKDA